MSSLHILPFDKQHEDFLRDESRRVGRADAIAFPLCEADVRAIVRDCHDSGTPLTIQGARTGITAGAVPMGGVICNLEKMNRVMGMKYDSSSATWIVSVMPGVRLADLNEQLIKGDFDTAGWSAESIKALEGMNASGRYFFPPDPTETTATIGGMVACNASGARSFRYGPTAHHIAGLRICLAEGDVLSLKRGTIQTTGRSFSVATESGRTIAGSLPSYTQPAGKSVAGFRVGADMDLIELFIGMEGTIGVITSIDIALSKMPVAAMALVAFMPTEAAAIQLIELVRKQPLPPVAIEFFNAAAIDFLRLQKQNNPAFEGIPQIDASFGSAVYLEYHAETEDTAMEAMSAASDTLIALGGSDEATWGATTDAELKRLKYFRHAIPEAINLAIDQRRHTYPAIVKLGTDMAVPDSHLTQVIDLYNRGIKEEQLTAVIFGHIGNNHLHVNILPANPEELDRGKKLYLSWARTIVDWGGTVSAEHGIGKSKIAFLELMYSTAIIHEMRALKKVFDPQRILNQGTMFSPKK